MSKFTDQHYLKTDQYRDSSNLDARVVLHQRFSVNSYGWSRWVFDHLLKLPEDAQILELGCGPAYLWTDNISRVPAGWHITLSDLSSGMLDAAWRNLVVTGRAFQFKAVDAQSIPFEEETFDAVIANHMLHHVPDKVKALTEIKRVLKPGGRLVATTVGSGHMDEVNGRLQEISRGGFVRVAVVSFTLENGAEQLKPFFSGVSLSRYEDNLRVTELKPLIAYIRSMVSVSDLQEDKLETLTQEFKTSLEENGEVFVTKASGLFEAVK